MPEFKMPEFDTSKLTTAFISSSQSSFAALATLVYIVLAGMSGAGTWCVVENVIRGSFQVYAINCMAAGNCGMVSWWFAIAAAVAYALDLCLILLARQMGVPVKDRYLAAMNLAETQAGGPAGGLAGGLAGVQAGLVPSASPAVAMTGPDRAGNAASVLAASTVEPHNMVEAF
jgi:hypothetical protein